MVEMAGFEPATPSLRTRCSPTELHPHTEFSPISLWSPGQALLMNWQRSSPHFLVVQAAVEVRLDEACLVARIEAQPLVLKAEERVCGGEGPPYGVRKLYLSARARACVTEYGEYLGG